MVSFEKGIVIYASDIYKILQRAVHASPLAVLRLSNLNHQNTG